MADRYQDRRIPADDYGQGGDQHGPGRGESDPLAELARLIGQTDPFGSTGRTNPPTTPPPLPPRAVPRERYQQQLEPPQFEDEPPAGPPPWMQRANAKAVQRDVPREAPREVQRDIPREPPRENDPPPLHPIHRHAQPAPRDAQYVEEPAYEDEAEQQLDPSRYDDALYGQIENGAQDYQREPAYPDDPYAYQDDYDAEAEEQGNRRRGALFKLLALLALAVVGTGSALAYRTYVGTKSSGEPPIIKADNSPTKIVPAPADNTAKAPDRMPTGDGTEKLVSREEAPVDINARTAGPAGGPRVVFPPLNPNTSPPPPSSVATTAIPPANSDGMPTNGTLPNNEPRKIRTFSVRGDQSDSNAAAPVGVAPPAPPPPTKPAAAQKSRPAAPSGNGPLSLTPEASQAQAAPAARVATTTNPPPAAAPSAASSGGAFLVSVSSQQSEADAQNSYRALQSKFPTQLGSRNPVIKRTELGEKVVYRAMVGPFATSDEAKQFCVDYKAAGGQCFVPRN
jgi:SPOR domain